MNGHLPSDSYKQFREKLFCWKINITYPDQKFDPFIIINMTSINPHMNIKRSNRKQTTSIVIGAHYDTEQYFLRFGNL